MYTGTNCALFCFTGILFYYYLGLQVTVNNGNPRYYHLSEYLIEHSEIGLNFGYDNFYGHIHCLFYWDEFLINDDDAKNSIFMDQCKEIQCWNIMGSQLCQENGCEYVTDEYGYSECRGIFILIYFHKTNIFLKIVKGCFLIQNIKNLNAIVLFFSK